ncbi:exosome complex component CSL4 isoform X2 [Schistocerca americana]|uniref:exosome complex component CSL4 isoform X2 n=1 Tax=Schistocerca americana TaxID=7009 RepID=UPI001F502631|nr:exosome complex component CSL4 isoform X2 [Schistocerca americana]XP_049778118.1 exosome complex component CSL4 isoform X1 [Schistocerca cancellata]XP_049958605.1 exosome complex component CSL4 isoform X1 [Schistocerca serialis cubense]
MDTRESDLICVPGQRLCLADKGHISGCGTYERHGYIYSALAGFVNIVKKDKSTIIEVRSINDQSIVPAPGDIVTAKYHFSKHGKQQACSRRDLFHSIKEEMLMALKVALINQRFCKCVIKCIGDTVLSRPYRGILRKEDVRATEKDGVEMYKCFRPGDIILARVLPMTDIHSYQLSTAENELGVVIAHSEAGIEMVPISWTQMQCPKTFVKEWRKVAKVVPEDTIVD